MRALIQRVHQARVEVCGEVVGKIDGGILAYIGIGKSDDFKQAKRLVDKILSYRILKIPPTQTSLARWIKAWLMWAVVCCWCHSLH